MYRLITNILVLFVAATLAAPCQALDLALAPTGDQYWLIFASSPDLDEAIAAAQYGRRDGARVARSANGRYAAFDGPYTVKPGTGRQVLDDLVKKGVPKDAFLTRGAILTDLAWSPPPSHVENTLDYDGEHDATMSKDGLDVTLSRRLVGDGQYAPVATASLNGKPAFKFDFGDETAEKPASSLKLVRLDPASPRPQVMVNFFSQGAHCCTLTKIASLDKGGAWHIVDAGANDGDSGYGLEDLEGQGFADLVTIDQSFLYAFDSYAASTAPTKIRRLSGDKLVDVTKDPAFRHPLLQSLYAQDMTAKDDPNVWGTNGFLAGWVASSFLVGKGEAAWAKMLRSYDHNSDFGPEQCLTGAPIDKCPEGKSVKIAFPIALRTFLQERGYIDASAKLPQ